MNFFDMKEFDNIQRNGKKEKAVTRRIKITRTGWF